MTLGATDVQRSADFYRRLGLRQIVAAYPDYARFVAPEGDATLSLQRVDVVAAPTTTVHFESDVLDETVRELEGRGFVFDLEPTDQSYLWREAALRDPDGNVVFIYSAGENRLDPPWKLGS